MPEGHAVTALGPIIAKYLQHASGLLARGRTRAVRLAPLVAQATVAQLIKRRCALYSECAITEVDFGYHIQFRHRFKASTVHPAGRTVEGEYDVLVVSADLCLLASFLPSEAHGHGPGLLLEWAYPIARRPFVHSAALVSLVGNLGTGLDCTPLAVDSMGYDRKTLEFRRDYKRQPVGEALREMREQCRHLHKVKVRFSDPDGRAVMVASFNRYGETAVYRGSVAAVVERFILPTVAGVMEAATNYDVPRADRSNRQEVLELVFSEPVFRCAEDMQDLCRATRTAPGLSVTAVHLNPYLQAQVLDFLSGAALELIVMDEQTVSLIPRTGACQSALERVSQTIFCYFGEATVRRQPIAV